MFRIDRAIRPWREASALTDHINLYGFWNENAFLTKSGDLGMVLRVTGVDYESLDSGEQEYAVKRLEAALKSFGAGFHVYQYLFKQNRPEVPFASYDDQVVTAAIEQRKRFFESKRDRLYSVEIFYVILLEGTRSKRGVSAALGQLFHDPAGAIAELQSQFSSASMKKLLRSHIVSDLARLEQRVQAFVGQLADFVDVEVLQQAGQFRFLRRLLNYDQGRIAGSPQSTEFLDYQVVNSDMEAERDHLRVGPHFVRVLTMKEAIGETRPLVLDALLKIDGNFLVCTEWVPITNAKARKEVNKRRRHFNISKIGFVSQLGNDSKQVNPRDVLVDESKQADIENLGDCLRALGDGQSLGDFSLTVVLYSESKENVDRLAGEFTSVFTNADGNLFAETYNQLNAYFAIVPGNYALNLRKLYLLNSNYADLSFLFTILPGETRNPHLDSEYLAILETDNSTPYFLNLHNGEVAHTLILGMTGSGKSSTLRTIREAAEQQGYRVEGFAPTSRAAQQLRDVGVSADTLQAFLVRARQPAPERHLYMVDESSLASTNQVRDFLGKLDSGDRVLFIGDVRQHQGVDAGKPFEQLVYAGMKTAQLDQIVRQKDPELLRAVEHLSRGEVAEGIALLEQQGRITEVVDPQKRIASIARSYVQSPEDTIIVSPDNASRREINQAVRAELQEHGIVDGVDHTLRVLVPRSDMTGADRTWAANYDVGDIIRYQRGSKTIGIEKQSYATVVATRPKDNLLTVQTECGRQVTYDPARLLGISAYRELELEFAVGDRLSFTAPNRELGVANRDLGTIEHIGRIGHLSVRMDNGKSVSFDAAEMRHFDHGYAVTSHSSQALTSERVLVNMDTEVHPELISQRFAYVSVSRASHDAQIFTNDAANLAESLSRDVSKASAIDFGEMPVASVGLEHSAALKQTPSAGLGLGL